MAEINVTEDITGVMVELTNDDTLILLRDVENYFKLLFCLEPKPACMTNVVIEQLLNSFQFRLAPLRLISPELETNHADLSMPCVFVTFGSLRNEESFNLIVEFFDRLSEKSLGEPDSNFFYKSSASRDRSIYVFVVNLLNLSRYFGSEY